MNPSELKKFLDEETKSNPPNILPKKNVEEFILKNVNKVLGTRMALSLRHSLSAFFVVQLQGDSSQIPSVLGKIWNHREALDKEIHLQPIEFLVDKVLSGSKSRNQEASASNVLKRIVEVIHEIYAVIGVEVGEDFCRRFSESLILKGEDKNGVYPMKHCVRTLKSLIKLCIDPCYPGAFSIICEIVSWAFSKPQGDQKKIIKNIHVLGEMARHLVDTNAPRANGWQNADAAKATGGAARRYMELKYDLVVQPDLPAPRRKAATKKGTFNREREREHQRQFVAEASKLVQHLASVSARRVVEWSNGAGAHNNDVKVREWALVWWPPVYCPQLKGLLDGNKPGCLELVLRHSADWLLRQPKGTVVPATMKAQVISLCTHANVKVRKEACTFFERLHPMVIPTITAREWIQLSLAFASEDTSMIGEDVDICRRAVKEHPGFLDALARLDVEELVILMDQHPNKRVVRALVRAWSAPTRNARAEHVATHLCAHKQLQSIRALDMLVTEGATLPWTTVFPRMHASLITDMPCRDTVRATLKVLRKIFLNVTKTMPCENFDGRHFVDSLSNCLRKCGHLHDTSILRRIIQLFCAVNKRCCLKENENNESYIRRLLSATHEGSKQDSLDGSLKQTDQLLCDAFSLACHIEMGPINKKYLLDAASLMHNIFTTCEDDAVREDVLLIQLQLHRSLKLNPPANSDVSPPLAKKFFSNFIDTDLKYAFEKNLNIALPAACKLMSKAVKEGDGIKVEVLAAVAKFVNDMFSENRMEAIKFLGAVVERGIHSPSDFSFDGNLIAVMIGDLGNSEVAFQFLRGMQPHHVVHEKNPKRSPREWCAVKTETGVSILVTRVARGFLVGRERVRDFLEPTEVRKDDEKRVEWIVNLLSLFDSAGRIVIGAAMLKCIKAASSDLAIDVDYMILVATGMSIFLPKWPDSLVERWCSEVTSTSPETRELRILQATAFWMCQQNSNKASLRDTIMAAGSLVNPEDIKTWWSEMRFDVLDFHAPLKKRRRVSLASTVAPDEDVGVVAES